MNAASHRTVQQLACQEDRAFSCNLLNQLPRLRVDIHIIGRETHPPAGLNGRVAVQDKAICKQVCRHVSVLEKSMTKNKVEAWLEKKYQSWVANSGA